MGASSPPRSSSPLSFMIGCYERWAQTENGPFDPRFVWAFLLNRCVSVTRLPRAVVDPSQRTFFSSCSKCPSPREVSLRFRGTPRYSILAGQRAFEIRKSSTPESTLRAESVLSGADILLLASGIRRDDLDHKHTYQDASDWTSMPTEDASDWTGHPLTTIG